MTRRQGLTILLALLLTLTGCSLEDERDECCYQARLIFHETIAGTDRFEDDIRTMRHFVFDDKGNYMQEVMSDPLNIREVSLTGLDDGPYTMLTIANSTGKTAFGDSVRLETFMIFLAELAGTRQDTDTRLYGNTDELYWNRVDFTVDGESHVYYCPLSNIHCHLHVRAEWKGVPRQQGEWTMRLYGVSDAYQLGEEGLAIDEWHYPLQNDEYVSHAVTSSIFNFELEAEFITFRWSGDHMPSLQIWCDDEPSTKRMDLEKAFSEWGWNPDLTLVQDYWLDLTIGDDGSVDMRPGNAKVNDWINGGTISN